MLSVRTSWPIAVQRSSVKTETKCGTVGSIYIVHRGKLELFYKSIFSLKGVIALNILF